jgi:hypothetical protein
MDDIQIEGIDEGASSTEGERPGHCRIAVALSDRPADEWLQAFFALAAVRRDSRPWTGIRAAEAGLLVYGVALTGFDSALEHLRVLVARANEETRVEMARRARKDGEQATALQRSESVLGAMMRRANRALPLK